MRNGPKPLSMHLGMTGACLQGQEKAVQDFTDMVRGIQLYQKSPYKPSSSSRSAVWSNEQTQLLRIINDENYEVGERDMCVLIPSLINGSGILDLCAERSLAKWLTTQNMDVYLLDWGDIMKEDPAITIQTLVCDRIGAALAKLREKTTNAQCSLHVLGYCMGGALSLGIAAIKPKLLDTLTLLATPWDFYAGQRTLLRHVQFWAPSALGVIENKNYLSADQLQTLFASVDPMLAQKKFSRFSKMDMESEEARIFVAVEDWLNDGKDLPAGIARECIMDWFINNAPYSGKWILDERVIEPRNIKIPVHIVTSRKDQLVEYEAAVSVRQSIPRADVTEADCGHIGMIAGKKSITAVWQPMAHWMIKQTRP